MDLLDSLLFVDCGVVFVKSLFNSVVEFGNSYEYNRLPFKHLSI